MNGAQSLFRDLSIFEISKVSEYFVHIKKTEVKENLKFNNGYLPLPRKVIKNFISRSN